jgi:hypothetical protein
MYGDHHSPWRCIMTPPSVAKLVLLCLAVVVLGCAETVWSLSLSRAHDPECVRRASTHKAAVVAAEVPARPALPQHSHR